MARRRRVDTKKIIAGYKEQRPVGYTSKEDEAFAERQRLKGNAATRAVAQQARQLSARQVTARGLGGAAAAALENNASGIEAAGAEESARTSADTLYGAFNSNLGYERHKADTAFGAEMETANQENARLDAQNSSFWNSLMEAIPAVAGAFVPGAGAAAAGAGAARSAYAGAGNAVSPAGNPGGPGAVTPYRTPSAPQEYR